MAETAVIPAINRLKELSLSRPDPSFWDANIIEAHTLCTSEDDHRHFWAYLTNPEESRPELVKTMRTLGDRMNEMSTDELAKPVILPLPDAMEEVVYENGNHITIVQRPKRAAVDDEKNPIV